MLILDNRDFRVVVRTCNIGFHDKHGCSKLIWFNEKDKVKASRIIRDTLEAKLIKPADSATALRYMKYIPCWDILGTRDKLLEAGSRLPL